MAAQSSACNLTVVNGDPNKKICVCDEKSCPELRFTWPIEFQQAILVESSLAGKRFESRELKNDEDIKDNVKPVQVEINLKAERQTVIGWGGSFTDSFGYNLVNNCSRLIADKIIYSYFGENGLQYNMARVPIGGSDFSTRPYTYDDSEEPDFELKNWKLPEEDHLLKIPFIKQAIMVAAESRRKVKLIGSPWSAPKWMKDSNALTPGSLIDTDQTYRCWANYLIRFYKEYEKHGIKFWGGTVQNEPASSYPIERFTFNGMHYTIEQMIKFVGDYLGPALEEAGYTKDKFKLIVGDESLGLVNMHLPWILCNDKVSKYVSGIAFHWYFSCKNFSMIPYEAIRSIYQPVKDKVEFVIMSEACTGSTLLGLGIQKLKVDLGSWVRGEFYAMDIMEDFVRDTSAWIDWNMALDTEGGPNWVRNHVDSPILVNAEKNEFYRQPMYYALAHFSRFFKEGSVIVDSVVDKKVSYEKGHAGSIWALAAVNKTTNHLVVTILNKTDDITKIELIVDATEPKTKKLFTVDGRSITTFILKL